MGNECEVGKEGEGMRGGRRVRARGGERGQAREAGKEGEGMRWGKRARA